MGQISVSGTGSAGAPPDVANLSLGVEVMARSVAEARATAADNAADLLAALESHGVAPTDVATKSIGIHPDFDHGDGRRLRGYRVTNSIEVRITNVGVVGEIIDAAAAVGDNVVVSGISFAHSDPAALETLARERAWADASRKATELAALSGLTVGAALAITENGRGPELQPLRAVAREAAVTPVHAGELAITVDIEVVFAV